MKFLHLSRILVSLTLPLLSFDLIAQEAEVLDSGESLENGSRITIRYADSSVRDSFPTPPLSFSPPLNGNRGWQSDTVAYFELTQHPRPTTLYTLFDREKPLKKINSSDFTATFSQVFPHNQYRKIFTILTCAYPVQIKDLVQNLIIREVASSQRRESIPFEVTNISSQSLDDQAGTSFLLVADLSTIAGSSDEFEFFVDASLTDALSGTPLRQASSVGFGAGWFSPEPLRIGDAYSNSTENNFLGAETDADIFIEVNHVPEVTCLTGEYISISPPVEAAFHYRPLDWEGQIGIKGDFEEGRTYTVTLKKGFQADNGDVLGSDAVRTVTVTAKPSGIFLPRGGLWQFNHDGLHFGFTHVNVQRSRIQVAYVPPERRAEFPAAMLDENNNPRLLADTGLSVLHEESYPGTNERQFHSFRWNPGTPLPSGNYIIQGISVLPDDTHFEDHCIISLTDDVVVQKKAGRQRILRRINPVTGESVGPLQKLSEDDEYETLFLRTTDGGYTAIESYGPKFISSWGAMDEGYLGPHTRTLVFTDRATYRPGQSLNFYGVMRKVGHSTSFPALDPDSMEEPLPWSITDDGGTVILEGATPVSPIGTFAVEKAQLPEDLPEGTYTLSLSDPNFSRTTFFVEDYRKPSFSVEVAASPGIGEAPGITVTSRLPSGNPNAGAKVKWKARWRSLPTAFGEHLAPLSAYTFENEAQPPEEDAFYDGDFLIDIGTKVSPLLKWVGWANSVNTGFSPDESIGLTEGEGVIDATGQFTARSQCPLAGGLPRRGLVSWEVEVINDAGSSEIGGAQARLQASAHVLGLKTNRYEDGGYEIHCEAWDHTGKPASHVPFKISLYQIDVKTSHKTIATVPRAQAPGATSNVVRIENYPVYQEIWSGEGTTPYQEVPKLPRAGHYVIAVEPVTTPGPRPVSMMFTASGDDIAPVVANQDLRLRCELDRTEYAPGDTAILTLTSPFPGTAWVTVEDDRILYEKMVSCPGTVTDIEIPITEEFHPNAFISVYMLRPATSDSLPLERYGRCSLNVTDPFRKIEMEFEFPDPTQIRTGSEINATLKIHSIHDDNLTEVLIYAVTADLPNQTGWDLPDFSSSLFLPAYHTVETFKALDGFVHEVLPEMIDFPTQIKGAILGDGLALRPSTLFRDLETPLPFWKILPATQLRSGQDIAFSFTAPPSVGSYNLFAVAVDRNSRFGKARSKFFVNKPVQLNPSFLSNLNQGDEASIWLTVENNTEKEVKPDVSIQTESDLIIDPGRVEVAPVPSGQARTIPFRAVAQSPVQSGTLLMSASSPGGDDWSDHVKSTFSVYPDTPIRCTIEKIGTTGEAGLNLSQWTKSAALPDISQLDLSISTHPLALYLPRLASVVDAKASTAEDQAYQLLILATLQQLSERYELEMPHSGQVKRTANRLLTALGQLVHSSDPGDPHTLLLAAWAAAEASPRDLSASSQLFRAYLARGNGNSSALTRPEDLIVLAGLRSAMAENDALSSETDKAIAYQLRAATDRLDGTTPLLPFYQLLSSQLVSPEVATPTEQAQDALSRMEQALLTADLSEVESHQKAMTAYGRSVFARTPINSASLATITDVLEIQFQAWAELGLSTRCWALLALETLSRKLPVRATPGDSSLQAAETGSSHGQSIRHWWELSPVHLESSSSLFPGTSLHYRFRMTVPVDSKLANDFSTLSIERSLENAEGLPVTEASSGLLRGLQSLAQTLGLSFGSEEEEPEAMFSSGGIYLLTYRLDSPARTESFQIVDRLPSTIRIFSREDADRLLTGVDLTSFADGLPVLRVGEYRSSEGATVFPCHGVPQGQSLVIVPVQVQLPGKYVWGAGYGQSLHDTTLMGTFNSPQFISARIASATDD